MHIIYVDIYDTWLLSVNDSKPEMACLFCTIEHKSCLGTTKTIFQEANNLDNSPSYVSGSKSYIFFLVWVGPIWRPFWRAFEPFTIQNRHQVKSPKDGWSIMSLGSSLDEQYICLMKSRTKSFKRPLSSVVFQVCDVLNNLNKLSCWIPWLMCVSRSPPTTKQNKQSKHHDSCFKQKRLVMFKHGCHETWTTK